MFIGLFIIMINDSSYTDSVPFGIHVLLLLTQEGSNAFSMSYTSGYYIPPLLWIENTFSEINKNLSMQKKRDLIICWKLNYPFKTQALDFDHKMHPWTDLFEILECLFRSQVLKFCDSSFRHFFLKWLLVSLCPTPV